MVTVKKLAFSLSGGFHLYGEIPFDICFQYGYLYSENERTIQKLKNTFCWKISLRWLAIFPEE